MISHHHECIFVHIPKTAGQSIERAFLADLGLSWATRAPLLLRYNDTPALGPPRLAHLRAPDYLRYCYISPALFERYFKFTVVRNPWDRAVSLYHYLASGMDFAAFCAELEATLAQGSHWYLDPQIDFLAGDDGAIRVDHVARFEHLGEEIEKIRTRVGLASVLAHTNASGATPADAGADARAAIYRHYYDTVTRDRIGRVYARDIERFGYRFEPASPVRGSSEASGTGS